MKLSPVRQQELFRGSCCHPRITSVPGRQYGAAAECFKAIWYPGFGGRAVMAGKVGAEGREIVE